MDGYNDESILCLLSTLKFLCFFFRSFGDV